MSFDNRFDCQMDFNYEETSVVSDLASRLRIIACVLRCPSELALRGGQ
jgi:hypothetical protein